MPPQSPLETRPVGPRRTLQKIFADKDLRDAWIAALEKEIGDGPTWCASLSIDARESGTIKLTYGGRAAAAPTRRSRKPLDTV